MLSTASPSPPSGLLARFTGLIGAIVWGLGDSLERQRRFGWGEAWLVPLADVLRGYLGRTLARFTALHARFLAGTLPRAPRPRATPPSATEGAIPARVRGARRPPAIPLGPVFVEYGMRPYDLELGRLLDDPEMRDFLAAVPQAGRILRALWRKLTTEPLPDILRPPPPPCPVKLPDGATAWQPIPCRSFLSAEKPPDPPRLPEPGRPPRDYLRIGKLFIR
ncbi:MAG: hypothetical protein J0H14_11785 [Alphaproteobacteria bacterium]|nr:hypothetical protein [Alphaproteobacteria bacterium]